MLLAGRFVLLPIMWDMGAILHCLAQVIFWRRRTAGI